MPPKAQFAAKSSEHALACKIPFRRQSQGTGFVYWLVGWLVGWFFSGIDNKIVCVHVGSRVHAALGGFQSIYKRLVRMPARDPRGRTGLSSCRSSYHNNALLKGRSLCSFGKEIPGSEE